MGRLGAPERRRAQHQARAHPVGKAEPFYPLQRDLGEIRNISRCRFRAEIAVLVIRLDAE